LEPAEVAVTGCPAHLYGEPGIQYANKPHVYTKKFIMYVWLAFFHAAQAGLDHGEAACMNMTRKPQTRVQTKLTAILF